MNWSTSCASFSLFWGPRVNSFVHKFHLFVSYQGHSHSSLFIIIFMNRCFYSSYVIDVAMFCG